MLCLHVYCQLGHVINVKLKETHRITERPPTGFALGRNRTALRLRLKICGSSERLISSLRLQVCLLSTRCSRLPCPPKIGFACWFVKNRSTIL